MSETSRPVVSNYILIILSVLITLITNVIFGLADIPTSFDFLAPLIAGMQLIFAIELTRGKLWGLIGYTITIAGFIIAILVYYIPKNQMNSAIKTCAFFSPLILLMFYYWTAKRSFFK